MREPIYYETLQEIKPELAELPKVTGPLSTNEYTHPYGGAAFLQRPMDLEKYGYLEEEYIVSGYANVYEYHDVGMYPKIRLKNGAYATRILIRRPKNPDIQSGFAILEPFNYADAERAFAGWGYCGEYMMSRGDIWVGMTIKQSAIEHLKTFDRERYGTLGFKNPVPKEKRRKGATVMGRETLENADEYENGLAYDAMSQVAALLKSKVKDNPLYGDGLEKTAAEYVIGMAASGCDLSLYVAALQPFSILQDGKPCFDGFHIHMTGYPGIISNGETRFRADDDRCKLMANVPIVWTQTMGDMRGGGVHPSYSYMYRWPDSDLPGRQHRQYEIAGAALGMNWDMAFAPCEDDLEKSGFERKKYDLESDDEEIPFHYIIRAVLDALKKWIKDKIPAPKSAYLSMKGEYPDADFVYDEHGNPVGGVRSPYVDVPTKTYTWIDDFSVHNKITPFSEEKLKELYLTHEEYLKQVIHSVM